MNTMQVYPNPATTEDITVIFHSDETGEVEFKLIDTFGRVLYQQEVSSEDAKRGVTIKMLQPLKSGLYLVAGTQGSKSITKKLVIK
jgi:Secretion system C-terminal sorting domain